MKPSKQFELTLEEEIWNGVTHGMGTGLAIAGLALLVALAVSHGDSWRIVSFSIYGGTLVLLYLASTLYHSIQTPKVKRVFRALDHAAIYLLIAGSYTPFLLVNMRGRLGWMMLTAVWGLALAGIALRLIFFGRFEKLAIASYLLLGWLVLVAFNELQAIMPSGGVALIVAGGVTYSVGVIFLVWRRLPYNHAIWHLFVIGGSVCHFFAMLYYVLPMPV